ncbi:RICIN domain-containing protein, partial [Kitasatospora sp. NPDC057198]|uniref:RICIN domain-containing protein n=1 Tax=Kitasatospora sp. NPDC057198 TaxID=3346046 RepID=UPI0036264864
MTATSTRKDTTTMRGTTTRRLTGLSAALLLGAGTVSVLGAPAEAVTLPAAGTYQLAVVKSGMCLDVPSGSTSSGTKLQQWGCGGQTNQQFRLVPVSSGVYQLVNVKSGMCVDVPSGSTVSGV